MFKRLLKFTALVIAVTGIYAVLSTGGVAADSGNCPVNGTPPPEWGNTQGINNHGFNSMTVHTQDGSTTADLNNIGFTVHSELPPAQPGYSYGPTPPGTTVNDRIFQWGTGGPGSAGRWSSYRFNTGENMYVGSQIGAIGPSFSCAGWTELGPGVKALKQGADPSDPNNYVREDGNNFVLDCEEDETSAGTRNPDVISQTVSFWIANVDTPSVDSAYGGHWSITVYNNTTGQPLASSDNLSTDPMTSTSHTFSVSNGINTRADLVWHPNPKPAPKAKNYPAGGTCSSLQISNNESDRSSNPRRIYVEITGVSVGRIITQTHTDPDGGHDYTNDNTYGPGTPNPSGSSPGPPDGGGRPASISEWVGVGSSGDGSKGLGPDDGSQSKSWYYIPWNSTTIHVKVTVQDDWDNGDGEGVAWHNITGYPQYLTTDGSWSGTDQSVSCYQATCRITGAEGDGPNGIVLAGGKVHVQAILTNTSYNNLQLWNPELVSSDGVTHNSDAVLDVGDSAPYDFDVGAPAGVQYWDFGAYPVETMGTAIQAGPSCTYSGSFPGGGPGCPNCNETYQQFATNLANVSSLSPTNEDPTSATYYTTADVYSTNPSIGLPPSGVHVPTNSRFYKQNAPPSNAQTTLDSTSGGIYPGPTAPTWGPGTYAVPAKSFQAGDEYCASINAPNYTTGYIGPGGADDIKDASYPQYPTPWCPHVTNEPYFKVYGSGAAADAAVSQPAGTTLPNGGCTTPNADTGLLAGWNDDMDPTNADRGAGSQLSALALIKISGFASAQTSINRSPTDLTFANTNTGDIGSARDGPNLGGNFSASSQQLCVTPPPVLDTATANPSPTITAGTGSYTHTGDLTLNGNTNVGSTAANRNTSIFVTGNVYIKGNINYHAGGWSVGDTPAFTLVATGNIYVDHNVTSLDGVYVAHGDGSGNGGGIYTCAENNVFQPMTADRLFAHCNNQLVVNGSFTADQTKLMRTFGSLRDETPNPAVPGTPAVPGSPQISLGWTSAGNPYMGCLHVDEPSDSHTWDDNYLCEGSGGVALAWTHDAGNPAGPSANPLDGWDTQADLQARGYSYCTAWNVPDADTWYDNVLCANKNIGLVFSATNLSSATENCANITESADPDANWSHGGYWLCASYSAGTAATTAVPPTPSGPPYACSNAGVVADPRTCAAEVFYYSPELFLYKPKSGQLPNNGTPQADQINSLPPVL